MARQIGKMLNAREPKIVNGPQVLDKYVGESEANIRKLFAEAEEEEKRVRDILLHVIFYSHVAFSALTLLVGWQEGHLACKNWVVGCWCGYLSGAMCRLTYGPADAIATHCLLLQ